MLTPFGKFVRKLRIEHDEMLLKQMAEKLDVSIAFASAVETGKKEIPADYADKIIRTFGLTGTKLTELYEAISASTKRVRLDLDGSSEQVREVAVMFARKLDTLSPEQLKKISDALEGKHNGSSP